MERERAQTVLRVVFETFQGVTTSTILHSYCQYVTGQNSIECQDVVQNESILSVLTTHRSRYVCGNHGGQVHTHLTITHTTHTHTNTHNTGMRSATIPTRTRRWDLQHQGVHLRKNDTDRVRVVVRAAHLTVHLRDEERDSSSRRRAHRVRDNHFRVRNSIKDTVRPLRQENLPWSQAK